MRRGVTLIELLAALAIFSGLALVCVSWLQTAASTAARVSPELAWRSTASRIPTLIRSDLVTGDFATAHDRINLENNRLRIHTRARGQNPGPVRHEYRLDERRGLLVREERRPSGAVRRRVLLDDVSAFTCKVDADTGWVHLTIESTDGLVVAERLEVP